MISRNSIFAAAAMLILVTGSAAGPAANAQESNEDMLFNEKQIKALLDESQSDTAFLVRLKMMRAHFKAAAGALAHGNHAEAVMHITHPRTEIYPEIASALHSHGLKEFSGLLDGAERAFAGGNSEAMSSALEAAYAYLDKAEATVDGGSPDSIGIRLDSATLLLRAAVIEYQQAFEYSALSNLVEYHDGAYFVDEARRLLDEMEPVLAARDPAGSAKLKQSLAALEQAWPPEEPPRESVLPFTKMQALVSIIELRINRLR